MENNDPRYQEFLAAIRIRQGGSDPVRATRFPLHLPMHYRVIGNPAWRDGRTVNVSRSGVLFRAEDPLEVDTRIEIRLVLPNPATEGLQPEISCQGRIVRTIVPNETDMSPGLGASIEEYEFLRRPIPA